ncbi:MAG: efflux transporter outer membrane subunit [Chlamydiales bacterium]|nr:efflux transporter outer membrane subunit [Chlamydiales bacterium]
MIGKIGRLCFSIVLLSTTCCNLAPRYFRPHIDFPEQWYRDHCINVSDYNIRWWEDFGDPVLTCLIKEALSYNPDLYLATERLCEFYAKFRITVADRLPYITGNFNVVKQQLSASIAPLEGQSRIQDTFMLFSAATWEMDLWGQLENRSVAAWNQWLAQSHARRSVILTLVSTVAIEYLRLREFDRQLEIAIETLTSREESLELAQLRYEGGLTSELEVRQAESEVGTAAAAVVRFKLFIAHSEDLISVLTGSSPHAIERGLTLEQLATDQPIPAGIPARIVYQRPDIQKADAELVAAGALVGSAKANLFPNIQLTGNIGQQSQQLKNLFTDPSTAWAIGANIMQIFYDGGKTCAEIQAASSIRMQAVYNFQSVVLNALREVEDALVAHQLAIELVGVQADRVVALQSYLQLATLQYDNGQTDYLNVLDAERQLFAAELDLASAQSNVLLTRVRIYKALGGDWVDLTEDELDCYYD